MKKNKKIRNKVISIGLKVATIFVPFFLMKNTVFGTDNPLTVINNLSTFIFSIVKAIGMILLLWGIVQIGMALKSHDPAQRASGFMTLGGAVIITFAKEILDLITGG